VIGGDITKESIVLAKRHYGQRVELAHLDAHRLPFRDNSFDAVVCVAAVIYMDLPVFLEECYRVLRKCGTLAINTPNRNQPGFRGSPLSCKYYSVPELHSQLQRCGFEVEFFGAFPVRQNTTAIWSRIIGRPSLFRLRKFTASGLRLLGLYEAVTQPGRSGTATMTLTEELKEEDVKLVQGIQLVPLSCSVPDLKHRIVYAVAQTR
jgi:SAM-dependent methyltransferase